MKKAAGDYLTQTDPLDARLTKRVKGIDQTDIFMPNAVFELLRRH